MAAGLLALILAMAGMLFAATLIASALSEAPASPPRPSILWRSGREQPRCWQSSSSCWTGGTGREGQRASGLLVPAALLAFGAIAINYVFGGSLLFVPLVAFAILTLCWLNSTGADPTERGPVTAAWLRIGAPLTGLVIVVMRTQAHLPLFALRPTGDTNFAMVALALGYAINLGILVHALRRRRDEGQDEPVAAAEDEPPQTPA